MSVTYSAEQRRRAKADQRPLVTFAFDDRHVTPENGGRFGSFEWQGPMDAAAAEKLRGMVLGMIASGELKA